MRILIVALILVTIGSFFVGRKIGENRVWSLTKKYYGEEIHNEDVGYFKGLLQVYMEDYLTEIRTKDNYFRFIKFLKSQDLKSKEIDIILASAILSVRKAIEKKYSGAIADYYRDKLKQIEEDTHKVLKEDLFPALNKRSVKMSKNKEEYERAFRISWSKERGINRYMAFDVQNALRRFYKDKSIKVEEEKK